MPDLIMTCKVAGCEWKTNSHLQEGETFDQLEDRARRRFGEHMTYKHPGILNAAVQDSGHIWRGWLSSDNPPPGKTATVACALCDWTCGVAKRDDETGEQFAKRALRIQDGHQRRRHPILGGQAASLGTVLPAQISARCGICDWAVETTREPGETYKQHVKRSDDYVEYHVDRAHTADAATEQPAAAPDTDGFMEELRNAMIPEAPQPKIIKLDGQELHVPWSPPPASDTVTVGQVLSNQGNDQEQRVIPPLEVAMSVVSDLQYLENALVEARMGRTNNVLLIGIHHKVRDLRAEIVNTLLQLGD